MDDITRREAVKGLAALAAVPAVMPVLTAAAASGAALREPGSLPHPHLAPGTDTIPQIEHIVVLMMENHSYDNKLGMLGRPGADGLPRRFRSPTGTSARCSARPTPTAGT